MKSEYEIWRDELSSERPTMPLRPIVIGLAVTFGLWALGFALWIIL